MTAMQECSAVVEASDRCRRADDRRRPGTSHSANLRDDGPI
jgi:hypothetical protein